jgi:hypothetical protein
MSDEAIRRINMSPRRNMLTVKGWSNPKKGKLYKGLVKRADNKTTYLHINVESLQKA